MAIVIDASYSAPRTEVSAGDGNGSGRSLVIMCSRQPDIQRRERIYRIFLKHQASNYHTIVERPRVETSANTLTRHVILTLILRAVACDRKINILRPDAGRV